MAYKSLYNGSDKEIGAAQYIGELACFNRAQDCKIELPLKFWDHSPQWNSYLIVQIKHASSLLKKYPPDVIIKVVRNKKIYSLGAKWIDGCIATECKNQPQTTFDEIVVTENPTFAPKNNKNMDFLD